MTKNNTPALRFAGFDGEWDRCELNQIGSKSTTRNADSALTETFTNSAQHGIISQLDYFDHAVSNPVNISKYSVVEPDDFVYNPRISVTAPFGPINRNRLSRSGAMSPLYFVFTVFGADHGFLEQFFKTDRWYDFMRFNGNVGARHDRFSISDTKFMEMEIPLPSLEEQRAIGEIFSDLDALIEQHRAKHANLQQTKTALLQRMFPQDGADEPELRLGGFSGAWVSLQLGDLGTPISGVGFPQSEQGGEVGTPFFKVSDMSRSADERELLLAANYVSAEQIRKRGWQVINGPAVVFAKVGAAVLLDRKRLVRGPFLADNNMMAFVLSRTTLTPDFALSLFETLSLSSLVQVGALPSINGSQVKAMQVSIPPTLEEQRAIGDVSSSLDALIATEANYITQLTQAKTALLQRMFV